MTQSVWTYSGGFCQFTDSPEGFVVGIVLHKWIIDSGIDSRVKRFFVNFGDLWVVT
jgi:hypothetical protein